MKPIDFIKLILRHKVILFIVPIFFGLLAILLTANPKRNYYSQTILYTGIASGSSIEMDKSFNYLATNNAFDNLINIIKSRDTQEEVAIRLLSQHLMLRGPHTTYVSEEAYEDLLEILPEDLGKYVAGTNSKQKQSSQKRLQDSTNPWDENDYEITVTNLKELMAGDNNNFVYSLLNFENPYYSLEAISKVKVERMSSSDLIKLSYETNDPGICQQTLKIYIEVCIKKYKDLKENGSDAVVKYFQAQLKQSEEKLKRIEQKLLKFNQENNIINYYEQSKAVAIVKEDMQVAYKKSMAQLAGSEASSKRLEEKLKIQELIQVKNNSIVDSKKRLGELNYQIAMYEAKLSDNTESSEDIETLKKQATALQKEIKRNVDDLYSFQNSTEGVPIKKVLPDWVDKVVETEDLKAKIEVMDGQNKAIEQQFAKYAPAGSNLKRIEREIEVAEQEYLEILHGLNLAKLKFQDTQLSSNLKAVDPPYFPLKPIPSKRKIIIVAIAFLSGLLVLGSILFMEFFDDTLKNEERASEKLGIPALGMLAKIFKSSNGLDLTKIQGRLMEFLIQNLTHALNEIKPDNGTKIITILSTRPDEGKSTIAYNIARKLKSSDKSILVLNHSNKKKTSTTNHSWSRLCRFLGYNNLSIDLSHPFLCDTMEGLSKNEILTYNIDSAYYNAKSYKHLGVNLSKNTEKRFDYIIIELPNLLEMNYSPELVRNSDLVVMACRSNRLWSKADENILKNLKEIAESKLHFVINGVELQEVETLLGELPKFRSDARKKIKNLLRFQFYTSNHI